MSMMRIAPLAVLAFLSTTVLGSEPNNPFAELDTKIAGQLTGDAWNDASKSYVRVLWEDYKKAHLRPPGGTLATSTGGKPQDVADANDYVGDYSKTLDGQARLMRIRKSEAGHLFVELEGHRFPAVLANEGLLFTTGDIVRSRIPTFTGKPYGELEMMTLSRKAGQFYFGPPGGSPQTSTEVFRVRPEQADAASTMSAWVEKAIGEGFDALKKDIVPLLTDFTNWELPAYPLLAVNQSLIAQINDDEMLEFLKSRGVQLTPKEIVTTDNLVAYLRYKKLGTEASYAWLDLTKGNPNFARAVSDWQTIRNERGYEFIPTYYLLYGARLKDKRDSEVWADFFRAVFNSLSEQDTGKKTLVAMCVLSHLGQFREIQPPPPDRFAFLAEELEKQKDVSRPYSQVLLLTLFSVDFSSRNFAAAAKWSKDLKPPSAGLFLSFASHASANNVDGAAAALASLERAAPNDREKLDLCQAVVRRLSEKRQNRQDATFRQAP